MESAWPALLLSLKVAGLATAIDLVLGVAVGWLLARRRFPGREFLDTVLTLPMVQSRDVLIWGNQPDWTEWGMFTAGMALFAWLGFVWFQSIRKGFADVL